MLTTIRLSMPNRADPGQLVNVVVSLQNNTDLTIYAIVVLNANEEILEGDYKTITPGQEQSWEFTFTMPENAAVVTAQGWVESAVITWHKDNEISRTIRTGVGLGLTGVVLTGALVGVMLIARRRK